MYEFIDQTISEARAGLTGTLKRMACGEQIAVVIRKRGREPQGVIISAPEAGRYFNWRAEQARNQSKGRTDAEPTLVEQDEAQEAPQFDVEGLSLPKGWNPPEDFVRKHLAAGHEPEAVFRALKAHYGKHGMGEGDAARIVLAITRDEEGERR